MKILNPIFDKLTVIMFLIKYMSNIIQIKIDIIGATNF